jgi:hypothetical protein
MMFSSSNARIRCFEIADPRFSQQAVLPETHAVPHRKENQKCLVGQMRKWMDANIVRSQPTTMSR